MSCEVICCEVPEILQTLVEKNDGGYLDKLFTFLDNDGKLDYYLAGYFEKILEMLFRRMTVPMMKYFNDAGAALLSRFLGHMDNYSIMQIVQRLMLPHIPFANLNDSEAELTDEERLQRQCNWSFSIESCQLLFDRMLELRDAEVPLHISDLLITVLQLSPPETLVISYLCEPACISRLMRAIIGEGLGGAAEGEEPQLDIASPGDSYTSAASVSLAAISVLESLNSRLFEASLPFDQSMGQGMEGSLEHLAAVREQIEAVCAELLPFVPRLQAALQVYLTRSPCNPFINQGKTEVGRLGHRGLQLVKLVESLVRMHSTAVDDSFCHCGMFRTCMGLMFRFESNSFLHLSVQRIIITVLESDKSRRCVPRSWILVVLLFTIFFLCSATQHTSVMGNLLLVAQVGAPSFISITPRVNTYVHLRPCLSRWTRKGVRRATRRTRTREPVTWTATTLPSCPTPVWTARTRLRPGASMRLVVAVL
jgi:hypothetical protein